MKEVEDACVVSVAFEFGTARLTDLDPEAVPAVEEVELGRVTPPLLFFMTER
jgi:hypothetical protein